MGAISPSSGRQAVDRKRIMVMDLHGKFRVIRTLDFRPNENHNDTVATKSALFSYNTALVNSM